MAKPNYSFEKRQRELAKKVKKEKKEKEKADRKSTPDLPGGDSGGAGGDATSQGPAVAERSAAAMVPGRG